MISVFFDQHSIDRWISEDAPLLDLTSHTLGIGNEPTSISFYIRHEGIAACTEEAQRIVEQCGAVMDHIIPSGTTVNTGDELLRAHGPALSVLRAWKVAQNVLEYSCGVARACAKMKSTLAAMNADIAILTTRKHAPGLKSLALKATLSAGSLPHRLGLSETILIFPQHLALIGGWSQLKALIKQQKSAFIEKKIIIEAETPEEAAFAIEAGADVIQFDKVSPENLSLWISNLKKEWPHGLFLAAGGINNKNVADYALTGVDGLVTSSLHYAPPADIGVNINPL